MAVARRATELRGELNFLLEIDEKNYVYWFERRGKGVFLAATPIDVSAILRERLFEPFDTVVLTSATLAVGGRFDFLKQRLGLKMARERVLPQEFDFREQALLYIPARAARRARRGVPRTRRARKSCELLEITEGRAFCLFTSYSQMNEVLRARARAGGFPLLLQGTAPRSALLEDFAPRRARCCLPRPVSGRAWTCRGEQLSCVIVDAAVRRAERPGGGGARARACKRTDATPSPNIRCPKRCWR